MDPNTVTMDEMAALIGYKELELFGLRKQLAHAHQVLADVTAPKEEGEDGAAKVTPIRPDPTQA